METAYAVPAGSIDYWMERFAEVALESWDAPDSRFDEHVLRFRDPDGNALAFIETPVVLGGNETGPVPLEWAAGPLHSVTLAPVERDGTVRLLTDLMGYEIQRSEAGRTRLVNPRADRAGVLDVVHPPSDLRRPGAGTIHHVAFRVADEDGLGAMRDDLLERGLKPTEVIARHFFQSVYFREPGGVLFELATDGPGFRPDHSPEAATRLMLPPWMERRRTEIEAALPAIRV